VAQALRRASLRLSAPERRLLGLRLFAGKSFQDIAAELGSTEAAAKMRYLRAARSLRSELEKEGIDYDCG
jgi:DNA-directed RNA polymerase specialized sigma24 family protein